MSFNALDSALIAAKKAIVDTLWSRIRTNFLDHNSRLNSLEASGSAPVGTISEFSGASLPTGWLLCDGSVKSQTEYADLYAIVGSTFNTGGEGAGNFRLPDRQGRAAMGSGTGTGLTARTLGTKAGAETVSLDSTMMPAHTHTLTDPGHTHTWPNVAGANPTGNPQYTAATTYTTLNTGSSTTGISLQNAGSGTGHNNMQPFSVFKSMIKH